MFRRACEKYMSAKLLVECVLLTASDPTDRRLLQRYAQMFADQITLCEQSKSAFLKFGDTPPGSASSERLSQSRALSQE